MKMPDRTARLNPSKGFICIENYIVEKIKGCPVSANLDSEINRLLQQGIQPEAFIWDDIVVLPQKSGLIDHRRLQWPLPDSLLYQHVTSAGRCAIRLDVLEKLYQAGQIYSDRDTSGSLAIIIQDPNSNWYELENVFRFVGSQANKVYEPLSYPLPPQRASSISIIINYRDRPELMDACLKSIAQQKFTAKVEIISIDNQSQTKNRQAVEEISDRVIPKHIVVRHLSYDAPFNHSEQNNMGVRAALGEVLIALNNDAHLLDLDLLQTLADWAITPGIATVGPRFVGKNGRLVSAGVQTCLPAGFDRSRIRESTVLPLSKTTHYTAGNSFACAAIARQVWFQLGGLNEQDFPTQYNDADLFLKALDAGLKHIYVGRVAAYHEPGQSEPRTRTDVGQLHEKLRLKYPDLAKYHRLDPALINLEAIVNYKEVMPKIAMQIIFLTRICRRIISKIHRILAGEG
jgi:GT2 family glycosyltransferase